MSRIDDMKVNLAGGGARPNRFRVRGSFPNGASSVLGTAVGAAAGAAGAAVGGILAGAANLAGAGGPARQVEFLCKGASIPESQIGTIEIPFRGRMLKVPGDRTFAPWTLTIINDTDFQIHDAFMQWMDLINSHVQNIGPQGLLQVQQNWQVDQLSTEGAVLKTFEINSCFPTNVSAIDLSYDSSDAIEEFTVELAYQYWTSNVTT